MARNLARLEFTTFLEMAAHLDGWAAERLTDSAAWEEVLVGSHAWVDYSARNQVLLASYGADGPVGGVETWRLVPSTTEGRGCAVRAGEHGYPVRVPVTTGGTEPDPYLGGYRPTRAAVRRWEWRPVFSVGQLARRPAPDALLPTDIPSVTGPDAEVEFLAAVRGVAASTVRGRLPKADDPHRVLTDTAGRLRRSSKRPELDPVLRGQVAWLVAERVGGAPTDRPPGFDPGGLGARERWERLQDVLEPARKLTAALGVAIGTDLVASPLPRMQVVDDRVVPAGRRHRLPAASLEQLPLGRWVTVGPYTPTEWAARGEQASGSGAYLRLNKTAYLVAVETGEGAGWRLEDVAARTGHGLLAVGSAAGLDQARTDAVAAVRERYPALAAATDTGPGPLVVVSPGGTTGGWEQMPGAGRSPAELWHFDDQITLYVLAGPGGRWLPAIHTGTTGVLERLPLQGSIDDARWTAEMAGRRAQRAAQVADPVRADTAVAGFADSDHYSRRELAALIGHRLDPPDQARVHTADPAELVELLGTAGFSPAATVAVLAAEQLDPAQAATLLPTVGVPMADAIRVLHDRWNLPRTDAAESLGATASEMRHAGCTPVEIMASRPRDILRTLPDDPHLWELAAGTMATAGHPTDVIARHLVAHAPTVDAFAAGLNVIAEPSDGLVVAARCQAHADQLAAASEGYGLSPFETASILTGVTTPTVVLDTVAARCDGDTDSAVTIATQAGLAPADIDTWRNPSSPGVTPIRTGTEVDTAALLAALPPPGPSVETDPVRLLDTLTAGIEPTLEPTP